MVEYAGPTLPLPGRLSPFVFPMHKMLNPQFVPLSTQAPRTDPSLQQTMAKACVSTEIISSKRALFLFTMHIPTSCTTTLFISLLSLSFSPHLSTCENLFSCHSTTLFLIFLDFFILRSSAFRLIVIGCTPIFARHSDAIATQLQTGTGFILGTSKRQTHYFHQSTSHHITRHGSPLSRNPSRRTTTSTSNDTPSI